MTSDFFAHLECKIFLHLPNRHWLYSERGFQIFQEDGMKNSLSIANFLFDEVNLKSLTCRRVCGQTQGDSCFGSIPYRRVLSREVHLLMHSSRISFGNLEYA